MYLISFTKYNHGWRVVAGFLVFIAFTFAINISIALALEVPYYKGYVNDYADMISPQMEARLERALQSFDLTDSTQVAVLTINSLEGDSIEEFSIRTVDKWKIGQKGKDNGVLLLVAQKDRKVRIEVGRGLEPVLTDLLSGRIIDTVLTPYFKAGKFNEGFEAGIAAIIQATRGEFKATGGSRRGRRNDEASPLLKFFFFGIVLVAFLGSNSKALGIVAGGLLFPLAFLFGLLPSFGFLILLLFIPVGALGGWLLPLFMAGFLMRGGTGYYGRGMGGGFGGSSGGFGGFGGGGFGGGGASGGW